MSGSTSKSKQVVAACIGNALEWYDFGIYGFLAVTLSKLFFPPGSGSAALLSTLAIFGAAFLVRPFGAALADLFPVDTRVTGMSAAYNFGIAIFGGFAPLIIAWLIGVTGNPLAPAYYVMAGLALSLVAAWMLPPAGASTRSRSEGPPSAHGFHIPGP